MLTMMLRRTKPEPLAMSELAESHYDAIWRFCYRRVGHDLASDAAQETFLVALQRQHSFRGDSDPKTWLFGIAVNVCRGLIRSRKEIVPLESVVALASDSNPSVATIRLQQAIAKLSEDHRETVILHEIDGFTYAEIGAMLGIPEGTVKSRLHHAFVALRKSLGTEDAQP